MNKVRWIIMINLIIGICAVSGCDTMGGVSKNMETLAKVLYAQSSGDSLGADNFIFEKAEVIETGKDVGQGRPVRFKMTGVRGYQTLSSPPPGWNADGRPVAWVGDFIEAEEKFDVKFVVFYTKDGFGKVQACIEGGFRCVSEENIEQHQATLENMVTRHRLAKEKMQKASIAPSREAAAPAPAAPTPPTHKNVSKEQAIQLARVIFKDSRDDNAEIRECLTDPLKYADIYEADLNGGRNPGFIVIGKSSAFMYDRGHHTYPLVLVYEKTPNGYKELHRGAGGDEVSILSTKTNGYNDISIIVYNKRLKQIFKTPYKYDGNIYKYAE